MIFYQETVLYSGSNKPASGKFVEIRPMNESQSASLFDSDGKPIKNPVITDMTGTFRFYAEPGNYDIWIDGKKASIVTLADTSTNGTIIDGKEYVWKIVDGKPALVEKTA